MPEHLGHVADVGPAFEHQCGHAVAQQVTTAFLVDARGAPSTARTLRPSQSAQMGVPDRRKEQVMGKGLVTNFGRTVPR